MNKKYLLLIPIIMFAAVFSIANAYAPKLSGRERHLRLMQDQMMQWRMMRHHFRRNKTNLNISTTTPVDILFTVTSTASSTVQADLLSATTSTATSTDNILPIQDSSTTAETASSTSATTTVSADQSSSTPPTDDTASTTLQQ